MKKLFILFFLFIAITSCDKKSKAEKAIEEIPMDVKVVRFDKAFFETRPEDLNKLKMRFPMFFPPGNDDNVWLEKLRDPLWRDLYNEVEKKFSNFEPQKAELEDVLKHIKYYYPKITTPKIVTVISEMDYHNKIIYADSLVLISLELYLGKDHKFYEFPKYLTQNFEPRQMAPDLAAAFLQEKIPPPDNSLLSQMIYHGKELYMKDLFLPDYTDAEKIGYKPEQIAWCEEYESYIWRYFIESKLLYDTDGKLPNRFINPAPFSKFYLEIDNDSPGRVGQWIGWQIVRSFMESNDIAPQEMLKLDAREIFGRSHYKPKKINEQE